MADRRAVYVKVVGSRKGKRDVWYDGKGKWRCGKMEDAGRKEDDAKLESEAVSPEESRPRARCGRWSLYFARDPTYGFVQ